MRSPPVPAGAPLTQISPPPRVRFLVARPRLLDQVGSATVSLVCGPAGSGKTTLLTDWVRSFPRVAWLSLEPEDDEPFRLWRAVLESLRRADALPCGSAAAALSTACRGAGAGFEPALVNALAELPAPIVLVLDDVHVLRSPECLAQLGFLLLHLPSPHRIVLASRSDPALPLHVLRVRTGLAELRAADLAFSVSETSELLGAHELDLPAALVIRLQARTEGWAAGVRMAALALQRGDDPRVSSRGSPATTA